MKISIYKLLNSPKAELLLVYQDKDEKKILQKCCLILESELIIDNFTDFIKFKNELRHSKKSVKLMTLSYKEIKLKKAEALTIDEIIKMALKSFSFENIIEKEVNYDFKSWVDLFEKNDYFYDKNFENKSVNPYGEINSYIQKYDKEYQKIFSKILKIYELSNAVVFDNSAKSIKISHQGVTNTITKAFYLKDFIKVKVLQALKKEIYDQYYILAVLLEHIDKVKEIHHWIDEKKELKNNLSNIILKDYHDKEKVMEFLFDVVLDDGIYFEGNIPSSFTYQSLHHLENDVIDRKILGK